MGKISRLNVDGYEFGRKSKDKVISNERRELIRITEDKGWIISNGACEGDWEGEFTYIGGKSSSVIDYVITNYKTYKTIKQFNMGNIIDSDHAPLELKIVGREKRKKNQKIMWRKRQCLFGLQKLLLIIRTKRGTQTSQKKSCNGTQLRIYSKK